MSTRFRRTIEDFTCEKCGFFVKGTGYTNHCPKCLWCKHVDVYPGDRMNECGGMMGPVSLINEEGIFKLIHECEKCGAEKKNKTASEDELDKMFLVKK